MLKIPKDKVLERIRGENPWWQEPGAIPAVFRGMRPRPYLRKILPLITQSEVHRAVVLMGPRRVGKTVLLHHAMQALIEGGTQPRQICYASIDHPLFNGLGLDDFIGLFREAVGLDPHAPGGFVVFDEIQYLRDWEVHLKTLVDSYPGLNITVSGSAAAALRLKSVESGAGRFTDCVLPPLTFYEYLVLLDLERLFDPAAAGTSLHRSTDIDALNRAFVDYLNYGGYPEVVFSAQIRQDPGRFIKSDIIDKVLLRDLPSLYGIQDIQELNSLFTTLAYNTANEVSLEELASGSGVAKNTLKRYMEYLEAAFLVRIVHRVDKSARRFIRANFFKVYLTNPSIRAALFAPIGPDDPAIGAVVETAIFSQWFHSDATTHYARWNRGEVDIVHLDPNQRPDWAVEIKWSDRIVNHPEELKALTSFCRRHAIDRPLVTTRTIRAAGVQDGLRLDFAPASEYCLTLGRNIVGSQRFDARTATGGLGPGVTGDAAGGNGPAT